MQNTLETGENRETFDCWIRKYLDSLVARRYSINTIETLKYMLIGFARWMQEHAGITTPDRLQTVHLQQWNRHILGIVNHRGLPCKPLYIQMNIINVRKWLRYLIEQGFVSPVLSNTLQTIRLPHHLPGSVLTHVQVRKMLAAIPTNSPEGYSRRAVMEVMYSSGLRAGEVTGLKLSDVNYEHKTLLVNGKGDKQRIVPVGRTAMRYLETYVKAVRPFLSVRERDADVLFLTRKGYALKNWTLLEWVHEAAKRVKLDRQMTCHTFRRSCATELIRNGANMYHVKELLGHESLDTMKHYARLTIMDLKKTHEKCHPREKDE